MILSDFIQLVFGDDLRAAGIIILNLILIESLLSIDNAAVIATMVMDLPQAQRSRALRIGILFAYIFRGLCLLFASYLIKITWLKLIGALYLLYLSVNYFVKSTPEHETAIDKNNNKLFLFLKRYLGTFWSTVAMVEMMDLVFSLDNVFAAVVYAKDNIYLIWIGVFIGIITMRMVATIFVKLMQRFPLLNSAAFVVIGMLGFKLLLSFSCSIVSDSWICRVMENEQADFIFSMTTLIIFFIPLLSVFFKKKRSHNKS